MPWREREREEGETLVLPFLSSSISPPFPGWATSSPFSLPSLLLRGLGEEWNLAFVQHEPDLELNPRLKNERSWGAEGAELSRSFSGVLVSLSRLSWSSGCSRAAGRSSEARLGGREGCWAAAGYLRSTWEVCFKLEGRGEREPRGAFHCFGRSLQRV